MNRTPSHCVSYALKTLSLASYSPPVAVSLGRVYSYYCYTGQKFRLSEKVDVAYLISKAKDPQRTPKGPQKDPKRTLKEHPKRQQLMVQRTPNTRRGRGPDRPLIAEEFERLRKKPPRASKTEPLDQLERLAILNGIRDGDAPALQLHARRPIG